MACHAFNRYGSGQELRAICVAHRGVQLALAVPPSNGRERDHGHEASAANRHPNPAEPDHERDRDDREQGEDPEQVDGTHRPRVPSAGATRNARLRADHGERGELRSTRGAAVSMGLADGQSPMVLQWVVPQAQRTNVTGVEG